MDAGSLSGSVRYRTSVYSVGFASGFGSARPADRFDRPAMYGMFACRVIVRLWHFGTGSSGKRKTRRGGSHSFAVQMYARRSMPGSLRARQDRSPAGRGQG